MRVIPNEVRDLSNRARTCKKHCVIKGSWVRSLAALGMTALRSRWFKKTLRVTVMAGSCGMLFWLMLPKPPLFDGISFSQVVRDRNGNLLRVTLSVDQKFRIRTRLRDISPELIKGPML